MATEYLILKRGKLEGPFEEDEVRRRLEEGTLSDNDLGRTSESYYWMPLHKLLGLAPHEQAPHDAPAFPIFAADLRERAWIAFLHYPWESGLVCLGAGLLVALLSNVPMLLYGPLMLLAITAGAMLFLRGRTVQGVGLCAAAILLPILVLALVGS